ncbi:MAG: tetratricopeptide repeat protein [Planctomycetales bacterium]|nr:tetratricopeptide repeat protein [Planctomycetales bacterium]
MRQACSLFALLVATSSVFAQAPTASEETSGTAVRGSIVEDRTAKKLLEAGDARLDASEATKAVEIWKSVIERYPRSRYRFDAHLRLGNYFLEKERVYDRARIHFEAAASEENSSEPQRAEGTLKLGICFYHVRNFGKSFQVMRDVIEKFPVSPQVNEAYYYIGLGHFQLGHYSRAIQALEKVGTTLSDETGQGEKLEAGKRLFVRIEDADLAVLEPNQAVKVTCRATSGDEETVECFPVGRSVRLVFGSIPTRLGKPVPNNGIIEIHGGDKVIVTYTDEHTADKKLKVQLIKEVTVVGTALVTLTDGAFSETVNGVVLGKGVNLRVIDADKDVSDAADRLEAVVQVYRLKSDEELEADAIAKAKVAGEPEKPAAIKKSGDAPAVAEAPEIDRWKLVDTVRVALTETKVQSVGGDRPSAVKSAGAASPSPTGEAPTKAAATAPVDPKSAEQSGQPADDGTIHTGVFQATVPLVKTDQIVTTDDILQALPSDEVRLVYLDEVRMREGTRQVQAVARCLEGNIGGVRVTKAEISDQELKIQTQLRTADALTQIGNRYKEFGLLAKANEKYGQALAVCEDVADEARRLRGSLLEQLYVQLSSIYFAMDKLDLASAMCQRLQSEFPNSGFVDDALLRLAEVAKKQGEFQRAIGVYSRLVSMPNSQLRGEAQFGVAECYEALAAKAMGEAAAQLRDRAFQEFKRVYDQFPESGRVGEAVAKMANYYYIQKDYARAIDTFETVLNNHPDAKFLDVILFNYGRCLFRMDRKADAQRRFEQLISEFPESALAADAKKISEALAKSGN